MKTQTCVTNAVYTDFRKAHKAQRNNSKPYKTVRLTKNAQPSAAQSDTKLWDTLEEAQKFVEMFKRNNPTQSIVILEN